MKCLLSRMYCKCLWLIFSFFITVPVAFGLEIKFTEFVRDSTLNNFVCSKEDTVIEKTGVTETVCAVWCQLLSGCRSIFYVPLSMDCTGCTKIYTTNEMLLTSAGSQHYTTKDTESTTPATTTVIATTMPAATTAIATTMSTLIKQWVQTVTAVSSEYSSSSWSANQIIGPPNVYPNYGDIASAWTQMVLDSNQYIEVQFAEAVYITSVEVYETYNAGGVKAIKAKSGGTWTTLWSVNTVQVISSSRIFAPPLSVMASPSKDLRLEIDCTASHSWVEIDAVQLIGNRVL